MTWGKTENIYLTEGDCFMLALEKKHMKQTGISNNTCRYLLTINGHLDSEEFRKKINANRDITWLASVVPEKRYPFSLPRWKVLRQPTEVPVLVHHREEFLPAEILDRKISVEQPPCLSFDIIYRSNGDTTLLLSWHHLMMDGYGPLLLLKQIAQDLTLPSYYLYDRDKRFALGLKSFWQAARAKFFVDRVSRKPLSGIMDLPGTINASQKLKILKFTNDETRGMDRIASGFGAQFGRSPFYLTCAARAVSSLLKKKGVVMHDLWIPVPRDQRKKGATGPVLGNHVAFLFYRIKTSDLNSFQDCVRSINDQTVEQIRSGMTKAYDLLIRFLRRTPLSLYYFWIKGPKGGSLASFLFTVAADHPDELSTFAGHSVKEALSIPSSIYPPGLTFAFMHHQGCLQLMILYFEGLLSDTEVTDLEKKLKHELATGTEFNDGPH